MSELTAKEEDTMLERGREMDFERKQEHEQEERQNRADEGFRQFKEDNLKDLQAEFCKESDEFEEYCRSEFKRWGEK